MDCRLLLTFTELVRLGTVSLGMSYIHREFSEPAAILPLLCVVCMGGWMQMLQWREYSL